MPVLIVPEVLDEDLPIALQAHLFAIHVGIPRALVFHQETVYTRPAPRSH
jgi:hypothetical protein